MAVALAFLLRHRNCSWYIDAKEWPLTSTFCQRRELVLRPALCKFTHGAAKVGPSWTSRWRSAQRRCQKSQFRTCPAFMHWVSPTSGLWNGCLLSTCDPISMISNAQFANGAGPQQGNPNAPGACSELSASESLRGI